jgi:hypothetical protein
MWVYVYATLSYTGCACCLRKRMVQERLLSGHVPFTILLREILLDCDDVTGTLLRTTFPYNYIFVENQHH